MKLNGIKNLRLLFFVPFFIFCSNRSEEKSATAHSASNAKKICSASVWKNKYKWLSVYDTCSTLLSRIPEPEGYTRINDSAKKFCAWLRNLPLKPEGTAVKLYNGSEKYNQDVHYAVVDIDCGSKDLQQCADAVMRLRAEYLYGNGLQEKVHFNYTSGDNIPFSKWSQGLRPKLSGNKVNWVKSKSPATDYKTFKEYLINVFNYAGSMSISKEMKAVSDFKDVQPGDVLVVGGFPGHAMTVMDVAVNEKTGKRIFLLSQSYMPAQDIHIVKNPSNSNLSPWYEIPDNETISTPEWTFEKRNLMRWKD